MVRVVRVKCPVAYWHSQWLPLGSRLWLDLVYALLDYSRPALPDMLRYRKPSKRSDTSGDTVCQRGQVLLFPPTRK